MVSGLSTYRLCNYTCPWPTEGPNVPLGATVGPALWG